MLTTMTTMMTKVKKRRKRKKKLQPGRATRREGFFIPVSNITFVKTTLHLTDA